ncbi:MAG TPA: ARMT1-like domain-containing protein [Phycisphaerae bacterium]|nr:ARMT1-like domain-containing protein [Phycisphaerae bacterium]
MPVFSLLAHPSAYIPCSTENMLEDAEYREYWLRHFETHFDTIVKLAIEQYGEPARERALACKRDLVATLHRLRGNPRLMGRLDLLLLDMLRQEQLIAHGIPDPFEKTKARENDAMLALYPRIVGELDAHADLREALQLAVEGVFAGNIFDLGAGATTRLFASESPDFLKVRDDVGKKRPWLIDHFDALAERLLRAAPNHAPPYKQALFFCDNAGSDFVLGVMPFCRWLAQRGTRVVIAANRLPALNDMTVAEVRALIPRLQAIDPVLDRLVQHGIITAIDSGGIAPLIDLREVSADVNAAAPRTDLVILEGMGRACESNLEAAFTVDSLKLAMIKEEIVARRHGGKVFDSLCRFDPATPI